MCAIGEILVSITIFLPYISYLVHFRLVRTKKLNYLKAGLILR